MTKVTYEELRRAMNRARSKKMITDNSAGIFYEGNWPTFNPEIFTTAYGTPYLKEPGVALISRPTVNLAPLTGFLAGFPSFDPTYIEDKPKLDDGTQLCKTAGQLCYLSFREKRTKNADVEKYFDNITQSGHGSVLEHANYSLLFWGIDRAVTHEIVRHRAGFAYSQVSQRYCDGETLRFVLRPELDSPDLRLAAEESFDAARTAYLALAENLRTELSKRKLLQQAARSVLPNSTEAPIIVTGNVRAWRHFFVQRGSVHADTTIRRLAIRAFLCLNYEAPTMFQDMELMFTTDNIQVIEAKYPKV